MGQVTIDVQDMTKMPKAVDKPEEFMELVKGVRMVLAGHSGKTAYDILSYCIWHVEQQAGTEFKPIARDYILKLLARWDECDTVVGRLFGDK